MSNQHSLENLTGFLKQTRDEIKLQIHLAKKDTQDEWERLEAEWNSFQQKLTRTKEAASDASENVMEAAYTLGRSIQEGYEKVKASLIK